MHYGQPPKTSIWVTTTDAGKTLGMTPDNVVKRVSDGRLQGHKVRGRILVRTSSITLYQARYREKATAR